MSRNKTGLWLNTSNLPGITDCPATAHKSLCMAQQTSVSTAIAPWNCILEPPTTPTPPPAHNEMSWNRGSLLSHTNGIVPGLIDLVLVGSKQILISYPSSGGELNSTACIVGLLTHKKWHTEVLWLKDAIATTSRTRLTRSNDLFLSSTAVALSVRRRRRCRGLRARQQAKKFYSNTHLNKNR